MQKLFSLFIIFLLCCCQNSEELAQQMELQALLTQYRRLPEILQKEDLGELMLLDRADQKIKLYTAIERGKNALKEDSFILTSLKEPYWGELAQKMELQTLLTHYRRLPRILQKEDLGEFLLLDSTMQKTRLYNAIQRGKNVLKEDSLILANMKEPYYDFDKQRFTGPYAKHKFEQFFFLVRNSILLDHTTEYYHFEQGYFSYRKVYNNPKLDCGILYGTEAYFNNECAKVIARKTKKLTPTDLMEIDRFITESSFEVLPEKMDRPMCLDGNIVILFLVKDGDAKLIGVRCSGHVINTLLEKINKFTNTDRVK